MIRTVVWEGDNLEEVVGVMGDSAYWDVDTQQLMMSNRPDRKPSPVPVGCLIAKVERSHT